MKKKINTKTSFLKRLNLKNILLAYSVIGTTALGFMMFSFVWAYQGWQEFEGNRQFSELLSSATIENSSRPITDVTENKTFFTSANIAVMRNDQTENWRYFYSPDSGENSDIDEVRIISEDAVERMSNAPYDKRRAECETVAIITINSMCPNGAMPGFTKLEFERDLADGRKAYVYLNQSANKCVDLWPSLDNAQIRQTLETLSSY